MANFDYARAWMLSGLKICRPGWLKHSYWYKGSSGIILYSDDTTAEIHLNQINARDWEIWEPERKFGIELIKKGVEEYKKNNYRMPNKIRLHPKAIKQLVDASTRILMGMDVIEDDSIREEEVIVYYDKKNTLSDYIIETGVYQSNKIIVVDRVKKSIKDLREKSKERRDINCKPMVGLREFERGYNMAYNHFDVLIRRVFGIGLTEREDGKCEYCNGNGCTKCSALHALDGDER